jgi:hypothetical protein
VDNVSCTTCSAGRYSASGSQVGCSACAIGRFSGSGAGACSKCPVGKYQPLAGKSFCYACSSQGVYQNVAGESTCKTVPAGNMHTGANGLNTFYRKCYTGTYESGKLCYNCPAARYQPLAGQSTCPFCLDGTFQAVAGRHLSCDLCTAGKRSHEVASGRWRCIDCIAGYYAASSGAGSLVAPGYGCFAADAGSYQSEAGATQQEPW